MSPYDEQPKRRLPGLRDMMILVATIALGFALVEYSRGVNVSHVRAQIIYDSGLYNKIVAGVTIYVVPALMAGTIGHAAVRLQRPRPRWRRLVHLPGTVGVGSVIVFLAWSFAWVIVHLLRNKAAGFISDPTTFQNAVCASWVVTGSWMTLLLTDRWHSDGSWIDRVGIALGFAWLSLLPLWYALPLLVAIPGRVGRVESYKWNGSNSNQISRAEALSGLPALSRGYQSHRVWMLRYDRPN